MKIGIVISSHNPLPVPKELIWAPGNLAYDLALKLNELGHRVYLFASDDSKVDKNISHIKSGINSIYKEFPGLRSTNLTAFTELFIYQDLTIALKAVEYSEGKLDILHFHDIRRQIYFDLYTDLPKVYTYHDSISHDYKYWLNSLPNKIIENSNIVALSQSHANELRIYFRNVHIVNNGININSYKFNQTPQDYFLFSGRLIEKKGLRDAVLAAIKTKSRLKIAGAPGYTQEDKDYLSNVLKLIKDKPYIEYLGKIDQAKLRKIQQGALALLMPIKWAEPFGLSCIESMASGTPVIAYNNGSMSELIPSVCGYVISESINQLAEKMDLIKEMNQLELNSLRRNARTNVEVKFSLETMTCNYLDLYKEIIKKY